MNRETEQNLLAQLGEELLGEFEEEKIAISAEFDRKCRNMLQPKKKNTAWQLIRWTTRAAVLVFTLIGVMTVTVLSVDPLRTSFVQFAAEHEAPEEEEWTEYKQITHATMANTSMAVYYNGIDSYQILWANEYGQRVYNFSSQGAEEAFFLDLSAQLIAAEE